MHDQRSRMYELLSPEGPMTFFAPDLSIAAIVTLFGYQGHSNVFHGNRNCGLSCRRDDHEEAMPMFLFAKFGEWWQASFGQNDTDGRPISTMTDALVDRLADIEMALASAFAGTPSARKAFAAEVDAMTAVGDKVAFIREHPLRSETGTHPIARTCLEAASDINRHRPVWLTLRPLVLPSSMPSSASG